MKSRMNKVLITAKSPAAKALEWDSQHFGLRIGSIETLPENPRELQTNFDLVSLVVPSTEEFTIKKAQQLGFEIADEKVELVCDLNTIQPSAKTASGFEIKLAKKSDIQNLRELTNEIEFNTRYTRDPRFSHTKAKNLYEIWVEKAVLGTLDSECHAIVDKSAANQDRFAGLCTLRHLGNQSKIGLFGISSKYFGRGLATFLLSKVLLELKVKKFKSVSVVTQGDNSAALHVYQKFGFQIASRSLVLHLWGKRIPARKVS